MADIDDVMDKLEDVLDKIEDVKEEVKNISDQIEALELVHYGMCTMCQGTGTITPSHDPTQGTPEPITCPACDGQGRKEIGSSVEKD